MEELQTKHHKEQRELQNTITSKKKSGTKKTRKAINDECEKLQHEMLTRQQAEMKALDPVQLEEDFNDLKIQDGQAQIEPNESLEATHSEPDASISDNQDPEQTTISTQGSRTKKPNRQKARLARRAAEQEAQAAAAADEAKKQPDLRSQELKTMKAQMDELKLEETFIQPDGHCLYSACAHSLQSESVRESGPYKIPYQNVRFATADFISRHPDDFAPFLEEPLDVHVKKVRDTAEWGGQLELQAIARAYNVDINVLQADGRTEKIDANADATTKSSNEIWLAYYRHSFGLGEHYNALNAVGKC